MRLNLVLVVLLSLITSSVLAQDGGIGFRALGDIKIQHLNFGSKDNSIKERQLNGLGIEALVGMNWDIFLFGLGAEYNKIVQQTDKEDVNNTNIGGSLINYSAAAGVAFGNFLFLGKYHFHSEYKLDKKSNGKEVVFQDPDMSYTLSLLWRPEGNWFWSLSYTKINYDEVSLGGDESKLSSKSTMELSSFGLAYGYMF
jgi:hypothetical protein